MEDTVEETVTTEVLSPEEQREAENLRSLVRSITKGDVVYLLKGRYGEEALSEKSSLEQIAQAIEVSPHHDDIVSDLNRIQSCYKEADHDTFFKLCPQYKVKVNFHDEFKKTIIDCLLQIPDDFTTLHMIAAVNKKSELEDVKGKPIDAPIKVSSEKLSKISEAIQRLIDDEEPGRRHIVDVKQVDNSILLTSYFDDRKRTVPQITPRKQVETVEITPAIKAEAKYDVANNYMFLKGRNSTIRKYLLEGFGKVLFDDNTHFTDEQHQAYNLEKVVKGEFKIPELVDLPEQLISATVIEEVLLVSLRNDRLAKVAVNVQDVEDALEELSNERINLRKQERHSITIELVLKQPNGRNKKEQVKISRNSKIKYNPRYTDLVHECLRKWGLEVGPQGN